MKDINAGPDVTFTVAAAPVQYVSLVTLQIVYLARLGDISAT